MGWNVVNILNRTLKIFSPKTLSCFILFIVEHHIQNRLNLHFIRANYQSEADAGCQKIYINSETSEAKGDELVERNIPQKKCGQVRPLAKTWLSCESGRGISLYEYIDKCSKNSNTWSSDNSRYFFSSPNLATFHER